MRADFPSARALDDGLAVLDALLAGVRMRFGPSGLTVTHRRPNGACAVRLDVAGLPAAAHEGKEQGEEEGQACVAVRSVRDALRERGRLRQTAAMRVEGGRLWVGDTEQPLPALTLPAEDDGPPSAEVAGLERRLRELPADADVSELQAAAQLDERGDLGWAADAVAKAAFGKVALLREEGVVGVRCDLARGPLASTLSVVFR